MEPVWTDRDGEWWHVRAYNSGAVTPELKLNNVLLAILKEEATWFKHQGKIPGPIPNFGPIIFPDYLQRIKPEVVTILAMP